MQKSNFCHIPQHFDYAIWRQWIKFFTIYLDLSQIQSTNWQKMIENFLQLLNQFRYLIFFSYDISESTRRPEKDRKEQKFSGKVAFSNTLLSCLVKIVSHYLYPDPFPHPSFNPRYVPDHMYYVWQNNKLQHILLH